MTTNHVLVVALKETGAQGLSLLVVKRKFPPHERELALPGGFLRAGEEPIDGALRELEKETGVTGIRKDELIALSERKAPHRDPRGEVYSMVYLVLLKDRIPEFKNGTSNESCGLVPLDELAPLAFDHGAILCEALGFAWPFIPPKSWLLNNAEANWQPLFTLPQMLSCKNVFAKSQDHEVVFFGGSFNPWHEGHRACLDLCPNQKIVIVLDVNPWKTDPEKNKEKMQYCYFQSYLKIQKMLEETPFAVYPGFWGQESANPTSAWLLKMPTAKFAKALLIGEDNFLSLPSWNHFPELIKALKSLYIVPRDVNAGIGDTTEDVFKKIKSHHPEINIIRLADHPYKNYSSTLIRAQKKN